MQTLRPLLLVCTCTGLIAACSSRPVRDQAGDVETTRSALTSENIPCSVRGTAVTATSGNVTFVNANSTVDSYTSTTGPYGGNNVGAHGNIVAGGMIVNNGGVVQGTLTPNTPSNLEAPTVPSGAINLPLGSTSPGWVNINTTSDSITLAPGSYVVNGLNVNYPGSISISPAGPVTIYVTGAMNLGGNLNLNGNPANLTFMVTNSAINVNSNGQLFGNIYAPSSAVNLNSTVFGYVVGASVTLNSGAAVHHDQSEACAQYGVSPTLNCVVQMNSTTYGAVFGYTNTTGANVTLGAGPHNLFSPGSPDRGQPILFVPGVVPIATFQMFSSGSSLSYTIGQTAVVASANSAACPPALASAIAQLVAPSSISDALVQYLAAKLAHPNFSSAIQLLRAHYGSALTPFQSSVLDAAELMAANTDLFGDPASFPSDKLARLAALRNDLLANPALIRLRLLGDAQRTSASAVACGMVDSLNMARTVVGLAPIQTGSLAALDHSFLTSAALSEAKQAVSAVATGSQASLLLAAPGILLAGLQSPDVLRALSLPDAPIPTGFWSDLWDDATEVFVVGGSTILGGFLGGVAAGAMCGGNPYCAVVGVGIGGYLGYQFGSDLMSGGESGGGFPCSAGCFSDEVCQGGKCVDPFETYFSSLLHLGAGGCTSCTQDNDCGAGILCIDNCCIDPDTLAQQCHASSCSQDSDCSNGDTCLFGCCRGICGLFGRSCSTVMGPPTCGVTYQTCDNGQLCKNGCCVIP